MRLRGGVLHVVSASRHLDTLIESLDGGLDWPRADAPLRVALVGAWRDERVTIRGRIDNPSDALSRRATGVALSVASRPLELEADGAWGGAGETSFVGTLTRRDPLAERARSGSWAATALRSCSAIPFLCPARPRPPAKP